MKGLLMVFLGGGLGSVLRYLISISLNRTSYSIPWGTLTVNIAGSLILGFVLGVSFKSGFLNNSYLLFLASGFCGGFTTFSTFAYENQSLLRTGDLLNFSIYTFGSVILGILAIILGVFLAKFV